MLWQGSLQPKHTGTRAGAHRDTLALVRGKKDELLTLVMGKCTSAVWLLT